MSGFFIVPHMEGVNEEVQQILVGNGFDCWKLIASNNFFKYSLASIFENICMIDLQVFEQFCNMLANHYPDSGDHVRFIYHFLLENLNSILPGFLDQSEYFGYIENLSMVITDKLEIGRHNRSLLKNHKFFTFFKVNLQVLTFNGTTHTYRSFGTGPFKLYVYSQGEYAYCLYNYRGEANPFESFVSGFLVEGLLLCKHPISMVSHPGYRCQCGHILYKEESEIIRNQNKPITAQNAGGNYNPGNGYYNPVTPGYNPGLQGPVGMNESTKKPIFPQVNTGPHFGGNNQGFIQPPKNNPSGSGKLGSTFSNIKPPPQNMIINQNILNNPPKANQVVEEEKKVLDATKPSVLGEFKLEIKYCSCSKNDSELIGICEKCKSIFYSTNYSLPDFLESD